MSLPDSRLWLDRSPYSLPAAEKDAMLGDALWRLTEWHRQKCSYYGKIIDLLNVAAPNVKNVESVPFIPVRLFKEFDLFSITSSDIFKTLTSSGTTGQTVSRIFLDRETADLQIKVLARLMSDLLGGKRLPMLVIDSPSVLRDRRAFSARGAGVLGFSMFGQNVTYALDEAMGLNLPAIEAFLEKHGAQPIFLFGFTFMIWQHFYQGLKSLGKRLNIPQGILLHGGGWKKLLDQEVSNSDFRQALQEQAGLRKVVNYYGMVEQTGSIFIECEAGHLHPPIFSDIVIRDPLDFAPAAIGQAGLIEVLSMLPRSYPGHALLTEDMGCLRGVDDCPCGRLGKYFSVSGRVAKAEIRGCSDTYEIPA